MPIILDKVLLRNPLRPDEPAKWHVYSKSLGTVSEKQVAWQIARRTALNRKEAEMALALLREIVIENLLLGYTVSLSDWATFYTTVKSTGMPNEEDANATKVKQVRVHLLAHRNFMQELQNAKFVLMDSITKKEKIQ